MFNCRSSSSENDSLWELVKHIKELTELLLCTNWTKESIQFFETRIAEYLECLTSFFPGCLKPKHHFLIHYPSTVKAVGPIWLICSIRHESNNREGKIVGKSTTSRVNICKTIAIKHMLNLNYRFLTKDVIKEKMCNQKKVKKCMKDSLNMEF